MSNPRGSRLAALAASVLFLAFPASFISLPGPQGIAWTIEVADGQYGTGGYNSIALAPDGWPGISYNADRELRYAWRDAGGWHNVTVDPPGSGAAGLGTSLAIDSNGIPHVGYLYWGGGVGQQVWYAYWNTSLLSWVRELAGDAGQGLTRTRLSLALDSSGAPHIAYIHTETGALVYASRAGSWTSETAAVVGCCRAISLRIDSRDVPHLAAYNYSLPGLEYYHREGAIWLWETVEATALIAGDGISLALSGSGRPRIAYVVVGSPDPQLKFANRTATMWSIRTVPTTLDVESYVSLALDPSDQPRIAYTGGDEGYVLKYSHREAGIWQTVLVDGDSAYGYASLAYDPSGVAHIAYYARLFTVGNLKYAKGTTYNDLPMSSVQDVAPYWRTTTPLPVQAFASDPDGTVARVDLYFRFDGGAGWGPWTLSGSDLSPPWSWSFTFPDGEGRYEFYSIAFDGADWEAKAPSAEASAGYDITPPTSTAFQITPYWWAASSLVVNASASDNLSGVSNVTLFYMFSLDNATWGPCSRFEIDSGIPWSWPVPFPDGEGYYRFHTVAADVAGNVEGGKSCDEAMAAYRVPLLLGHRLMSFPQAVTNDGIESVLSSIDGCYDYVRWYDPLDSSDHWRSYAPGRSYNDLARLDNKMAFWINIIAPCSFTPVGTRPVSTIINLHQGWNMVGFPSFNKTYTVADLKADIGIAGVIVEAFDASAAPYHLQRASDSYVMMAGEGYWVYVPSDATWDVSG
jgi:hypothetical protein